MEQNVIKRYSLSSQVADKLEAMIENGSYQVGQKIPTESELIELFQVSRNTIREAIKSLASIGLVEVKQGDGTYIKSNNRFDANLSKTLDSNSIDEVNEARKALEVSIAALACQRRTNEDLKQLKLALNKRQELTDDIKEHSIADVKFHIMVAKSCHNNILLDLYKSLYTYLLTHIEKRIKESPLSQQYIDTLHQDLYDAIENQDSIQASNIAKEILNI